MRLDNAQSRAALSAPVWPPETILGICESMAETLSITVFR